MIDSKNVTVETKDFQKILEILSFVDEQGEDLMKQEIETN